MTPDQLRAIISRLGVSQEALGRFLGVSGRTVRNWLAGKHKVPRAVELLLADVSQPSLVGKAAPASRASPG